MSFISGGSVSNMYAMNLARYKFCPEIKEKGLSGLPRLVLFTSEEVKTKKIFLKHLAINFIFQWLHNYNIHMSDWGPGTMNLPSVDDAKYQSYLDKSDDKFPYRSFLIVQVTLDVLVLGSS